MNEITEFESIRPYNDEETVEALGRVSRHPYLMIISNYLFPKQPMGYLGRLLRSVNSVDEFQEKVMSEIVVAVLGKTSYGLTVSGIENLKELGDKKFLAISNHRDIVLDPAIFQYVLNLNNVPCSRICVGDNLLTNQMVEDLIRSNRMIKVIRGIKARELYLSSLMLSKYIRKSIVEGEASIWIAQKEGRSKNGLDLTEQGLLKMFGMSGENGFEQDYSELNILPISISYEYESCDLRKARELTIKEQNNGQYTKKKKEDLHSILTGIKQNKGHIHLHFGKPLSKEEIAEAAVLVGNERFTSLRACLDKRIISGYKLFKTNYIAYDIVNGTSDYLMKEYDANDLSAFKEYVDHKISKLERNVDKERAREIFLNIYANPVKQKKENE